MNALLTDALRLPQRPLVFVTPPGWAAADRRADLERVARGAAKGGASLVQLRDADASRDELETAAAAVRDALQGTDCSVVINGVEHLPERKWRAVETRPSGPLGCSAHSVEAVLAAAALGADYVQLGTMFATQTHPGKIPEGPGLATECRRALDELEATPLLIGVGPSSATPLLIGVGGVDATNAAKLIEAGCDGVAVIRGISDARDPEAAARAICRALAGAGTRISKAAQNTRAETTAQNAADVRELMRTRLSMTEAELDRMVRRRPLGARATVEPKLDGLQTRLELSDAGLKKMVLALPALLTQSVEKMESNCDWLQRRLGLDDSGLKKVVLENPSLLAFSVEDNMEPKLDWLQDRLNLDAAQLKKVVLGRPSLLGYSVEDNMAPKLDWLQTRLELDAAQLKKLVVAQPTLLGYSVDANMAPTLDWLQTRLNLDDAGLRKVVLVKPQLLNYSVEDNMAPTLEWLQTRLDLDAAQLTKVVLRLPQLLGYSVDANMEPKLDWLQKRLDLDAAQLKKMVLTLPALLSYSAETNMAPKLAYLEREAGLSRSELRDRVLRFPQIMSYSLDKRYRPRFEACRAAGVDAEYVLTYVSKMDEKFYELLEEKSLRDAS